MQLQGLHFLRVAVALPGVHSHTSPSTVQDLTRCACRCCPRALWGWIRPGLVPKTLARPSLAEEAWDRSLKVQDLGKIASLKITQNSRISLNARCSLNLELKFNWTYQKVEVRFLPGSARLEHVFLLCRVWEEKRITIDAAGQCSCVRTKDKRPLLSIILLS